MGTYANNRALVALAMVALASAAVAVEAGAPRADGYEVVDCPATFTLPYERQPDWNNPGLRRYRCRGFEELSFSSLRIQAATQRLPTAATLYLASGEGPDRAVHGRLTFLGAGDRVVYQQPVRARIGEGDAKGHAIRLPGLEPELLDRVRKVALHIDTIVEQEP